MPKVSACLITLNEARNIEECLSSVKWADEIVVVDSGSTDGTVELCRRFTDRVLVMDWAGHVAQKNRAVEAASNDWVFCIDADERVTPELAREIKSILSEEPPCAGYTVPRRTWYAGRWIWHGGWYPDRKLRLFDRRRGRFTGMDPHDRVEVKGPVGKLRNDLLHYSYRDIAHHVRQINRYTDTMAELKAARGVGVPLLRMISYPPVKFFKMYLLRMGFLDGPQGLILAVLGAVYEFLKYAKLWEIRVGEKRAGGPPDK